MDDEGIKEGEGGIDRDEADGGLLPCPLLRCGLGGVDDEPLTCVDEIEFELARGRTPPVA